MRKALTLFLLLSILPPALARSEPIPFYYPDRPPYNYTANGKAEGSLVELVQNILDDAGLEARFIEMPSPRILAELQMEDSVACSFGWFKTSEREAFATFTLPIAQDTPLVALILARNEALFSGKASFRELAQDKTLSLGLIRSWSYGNYVDSVIKKEKITVVEAPERPRQAKMLASGRFLYTLVRESEVDEVVKLSGKARDDFAIVPLSDTNESKKRYILCGKGVPKELIERLNESISKICGEEDTLVRSAVEPAL